MDIKKLNPWNWFSREDASNVPVLHNERQTPPAHALMQLHDDMDRAFSNIVRNFGFGGPLWNDSLDGPRAGVLRPQVDVVSGDRDYRITVEVPGVEEKDVRLELLADGALVISGEKRQQHEDTGGHVHRIERSYGAFRRVLSLPDDVDRDKIDAQFKSGVLTITCPRTAAASAPMKQIEIRKVA